MKSISTKNWVVGVLSVVVIVGSIVFNIQSFGARTCYVVYNVFTDFDVREFTDLTEAKKFRTDIENTNGGSYKVRACKPKK